MEHLLATTSHMMFFLLFGRLGEGIDKPIQFCVVMEIKWKLRCQVVATLIPTSALEVEEKELKNLLNSGKFSFYVVVDSEIFTY